MGTVIGFAIGRTAAETVKVAGNHLKDRPTSTVPPKPTPKPRTFNQRPASST